MQAAAGRLIESSRRSGKRLGAMICATALLAAAVPSLAAAEAPSFTASAPVSLSFASGTARLLGPNALVLVQCSGSPHGLCSGTVTLAAAGHKHKVPFSVLGGSRESLTVPVGRGALGSERAVAVARTAQSSGGFLRSTEVLHFR